MSGTDPGLPHVYYTIPELSTVRNVRAMKNTKVKTIGYIVGRHEKMVKEARDSADGVVLDLAHVEDEIVEIYSYIIYGILATVNREPVITVKFLQRFDLNENSLERYKKQCLLVRNRLCELDDISKLSGDDET